MLHKQITKTKEKKHTKTNKRREVERIPIAAFKEVESKDCNADFCNFVSLITSKAPLRSRMCTLCSQLSTLSKMESTHPTHYHNNNNNKWGL
jgi:hypothetical protein